MPLSGSSRSYATEAAASTSPPMSWLHAYNSMPWRGERLITSALGHRSEFASVGPAAHALARQSATAFHWSVIASSSFSPPRGSTALAGRTSPVSSA